ncbi:porin [Winogradskyella alexanderae]|uniref:OprO/OprP family phosphate-selective porin n=1 Tax=Winogradskyella alexanderae TaxID=2877123 RepID=A0ABS7XUJ5_9FLAO|nr:porin [Winogradskyella alexanderae]MCA0133154.1 OprO/OprP family phosphate-selective porin [Winogradskyella alexanderae]
MKLIYKLIFLVLLFSTSTILSQGCDVDDPSSSSDTTGTKKIKLFGYLQPQFDYNFTDGDQNNTFKFRRARIGVRGDIYEDFSYYFMLEASPFIGNQSDVYLMDVFITYHADNWARISLGSYKQPFSLDLATPCFALTTIERAIVVDQLVTPQRDFGIGIFGGNKYNRLNYAVAIMNGSGIGGFKPLDNNTKKDIVGRATYRLTDFLTVGGSFRYGFPLLNDNESDRTTYGFEFLAELNKLKIQGEYIHDTGAYLTAAGGGCGGLDPVSLDGLTSDGAYIMAAYSVNEKFQPVFKWEYFDQNVDVSDIPGIYQERMTFGFNYFFNKMYRLQINYFANIETVTNVDNDQIAAQIQVKF